MGESQQQHQPLLRSINNAFVSFVRFVNKTMRNVVLYWIDYQGRAVSYGVLSPDDSLDIDTFVTHPWIFVDQETKERYNDRIRNVVLHVRHTRKYLYMSLLELEMRQPLQLCKIQLQQSKPTSLFSLPKLNYITASPSIFQKPIQTTSNSTTPFRKSFKTLQLFLRSTQLQISFMNHDQTIIIGRMEGSWLHDGVFRYTVNQKDVFFPRPSPMLMSHERRYPIRMSLHPRRRRERVDVLITIPVYTLRELCLRAIRSRLTYDEQAFQLDIPRSLQCELAIMLLRNEALNNPRNL